jgi:cell division inhibitor SepF
MNMAWKEFLTGIEEDSEYEEEETVSSPAASASSTIGLFEPKAFEDATAIANAIKKGSVVTVNLHRLSKDYAQRMIDFLTGVVYALDGRIEKVGHNLILCSPAAVKVSGRITMSAD